jgi:hypothetical protein
MLLFRYNSEGHIAHFPKVICSWIPARVLFTVGIYSCRIDSPRSLKAPGFKPCI